MAMPDIDLMNDDMIYNWGRIAGQRNASPMDCREVGEDLIIWMIGYVQGARDALREVFLADQNGGRGVAYAEHPQQPHSPQRRPGHTVDPRRYPPR